MLSLWLKGLLGCIVGAVVGGFAAVFIAGLQFFVVYPMFVKVNLDRHWLSACFQS